MFWLVQLLVPIGVAVVLPIWGTERSVNESVG